jgi:hypothetical protein
MERDCNTCGNHTQAGVLDDIPAGCWTCTASETRGGPVLPQWKPIEFHPAKVVHDIPKLKALELDALNRQIGGAHYKGLKIQPMEYSIANGLNACEHTAIKYITRKKGDKAKRLEDLDKAIHSIELLKQFIEDGTLVD